VWLWTVATLVLAIIGVGGATRLTDSGLSITEWQPILGAIPPLSDAAWQAAFLKYQQIPQYTLMNKGMSLDAFKTIYWWEWGHRQLGRLIGLAYVLPLVAFLVGGRVPSRWRSPLLGIALLIGLQGAVGWYMVQSGLAGDRIAVSPVRLTLHLSIAFAILGALVWLALGIRAARLDHGAPLSETRAPVPAERCVAILSVALVALIYLQVILGGLVAGTRAGLSYNTWPLMDGALVPSGLLLLEPWWRNLIENVTTVQFNHRMAAYACVVVAALTVVGLRKNPSHFWPAAVVLVALLAQMALGIATLLASAGGRIPLTLGVVHQVGAAMVFVLAILALSRMMRRP
jgi:cytochrome c oxidase assembly protein subunit 15